MCALYGPSVGGGRRPWEGSAQLLRSGCPGGHHGPGDLLGTVPRGSPGTASALPTLRRSLHPGNPPGRMCPGVLLTLGRALSSLLPGWGSRGSWGPALASRSWPEVTSDPWTQPTVPPLLLREELLGEMGELKREGSVGRIQGLRIQESSSSSQHSLLVPQI